MLFVWVLYLLPRSLQSPFTPNFDKLTTCTFPSLHVDAETLSMLGVSLCHLPQFQTTIFKSYTTLPYGSLHRYCLWLSWFQALFRITVLCFYLAAAHILPSVSYPRSFCAYSCALKCCCHKDILLLILRPWENLPRSCLQAQLNVHRNYPLQPPPSVSTLKYLGMWEFAKV